MTGMRKSYGSSTSDHKHQSFQVFAICWFFNIFNQLKDKNLNRKRSWGTFGDK
jgi:hypothetical protein